MRNLVLGGSVFVGRHLVDALLAEGHDVAVLNRGQTPSELSPSVERLVADRTDADQMRIALAGRDWDAVYDVSGFVMVAGGSDVEALLDLVDGHVGRYVYVSSIMAYDQSKVGVFPWTEDQPTNPDGPSSYGGFKAMSERSMLDRHAATGFPACVARPAAIYGPDNNIFDMETPMFLRLLQHRPILVPHGGLVVGSYGHVDDLCTALVTMGSHPDAPGTIVNVTGQSIDVNEYVRVLAEVVGEQPDIVQIPDAVLAGRRGPSVHSHLFSNKHHAMLSTEVARHTLGVVPRYGLLDGHRHTFDWFHEQGWDKLDGALVDPVWRASWDFAAEAELVELIRHA